MYFAAQCFHTSTHKHTHVHACTQNTTHICTIHAHSRLQTGLLAKTLYCGVNAGLLQCFSLLTGRQCVLLASCIIALSLPLQAIAGWGMTGAAIYDASEKGACLHRILGPWSTVVVAVPHRRSWGVPAHHHTTSRHQQPWQDDRMIGW